jgi:hypothetical protein
MRATSHVTGIATTLAMLAVSGVGAFGQVFRPAANGTGLSASAACAVSQCLLSGPRVVDAAFTAEATTMWSPPAGSGKPELRATARYYRDSAGRVRIEQGFVGDETATRVIVWPDVATRTAYLLDPAARTASTIPVGLAAMMAGDGGHYHFVLPLAASRVMAFLHTPDDAPEETLSPRDIAGVRATGTRFTMRLPLPVGGSGQVERWVSPELQLVVYSRSEDAAIGVVEHRLTDIQRGDPPSTLFEVPEDYAMTPGKYPYSWENPYAPQNRPSAF